MNNPDNLPVHAGGSLLSYSTPEEYAAAIKASHDLMALVDQHNQENRDATSQENQHRDRSDQFLYGQDFEVEPEVWELFDEIDPSIFDEGGPCAPSGDR